LNVIANTVAAPGFDLRRDVGIVNGGGVYKIIESVEN